MITIIIPGEPTGKARHRTTKTGHTYTPRKTIDYEEMVRQCYLLEHKNECIAGDVRAIIHAYFKIPKSATKGKELAMRHNIVRPAKKPDLSNIIKIIEDALNLVAYKDDSQIVEIFASKHWSHEPRVEVMLEEISLNKKT